MPINLKTPQREINIKLQEIAERQKQAIINALLYIGEQCINHARSLPSPSLADFPNPNDIPPHQPNYIDRTANLRNSIGYAVICDGEIIQNSFDGSALSEGAYRGNEAVQSIAQKYQTGYVLCVVAGEKYGIYVTEKGYDVIDSATIIGEQLANQLIPQIKL